MISREDIKRINQQYASQKDDTHKDTPIDRYNEPMYRKKRHTQKYASHSSRWTDRPFDFVSWT